MGLRYKLALILLPLTIIPLLLLGRIAHEQMLGAVSQRMLDEMNYTLTNMQKETVQELEHANSHLTLLADSSFFWYQIDSLAATNKQSLASFLQEYLQHYPGYRALDFIPNSPNAPQDYFGVYKKQNRIFQRTAPSRRYLENLRRNAEIDPSLFICESSVHTCQFFLSRAVDIAPHHLDSADALKGYLAITLQLDFLAERIDNTVVGQTGYLFAVDSRGNRVHASPGKNLPPARPSDDGKVLKIQMKIPGGSAYLQTRKLHNNLYLYAVLPEIDIVKAVEPLRFMINIIMLVSMVIIFICLFFALNFIVVGPIKQLAAATHDIDVNNPKPPTVPSRQDEIGSLYHSFAAMIRRLRDALNQIALSNMELENKVQERTSHLEMVNVELDRAREMAETSNIAKSQFVANISHELRTPLNGILGMTSTLMDSPLEDSQKQHLQVIHEAGSGLLRIINELLDVSLLERGDMRLREAPFSPAKTVHDVVQLMRVEARLKGLSLNTQLDDKLPKQVIGDSNRVQQVLLNLVGNALKFTEEGYVTVKVEQLTANAEQVDLRFSVVDTGIGIDKHQTTQLFNKFTQLDGGTNRRYGGTGLGLFLCKQLVELMDGEINVSTELNKGSTFCFTLTLPLAEDTETPVAIPPTIEKKPEKHSRAIDVLVVDDNQVNLVVAKVMLTKLGCQVHTANHGEEAFAMTDHKDYDIVLMDIQMPVMDGHEATRQIRAREQANDKDPVIIIAVTANDSAENRQICAEIGMNDFIAKPVTENVLGDMLDKWLG